MRFKIDENLPTDLAELLKGAGHEADTVADEGLAGRPDNLIASRCIEEERILVTLDLDFADIRVFEPASHPGIIILRLARQDREFVTRAFRMIIPFLTPDALSRRTWIVEEHRIRIREQ